MKLAWGVTGSGDKFKETIQVMKELKDRYGDSLSVEVFLSKAGQLVARYYKATELLETGFDRLWVETDSNTPFLPGRLQLGEFDLLLIAPATSNTVAKIAVGISDTLLTNSAIQAIKGFIPVYIMPVDYHEGETTTTLPNGRSLRLRVRKEDVDNVRKLKSMDGIHPFERPEDIPRIVERFMKQS